MSQTSFSGVIRLRKDTEANFNTVGNTLVLASGEMALVVTSKGIRIKVGDGSTKFNSLEYIDTQSVNNSVERGYYLNSKFYTDSTYTVEIPASISKIYIDENTNLLYTYSGTKYVSMNETLPTATDTVAGIMKLYNSNGSNTDGAMTQKAVTEGISNIKFNILESDHECLVLDLPW